jgi:succinylglutamate desuccinylase
VRHKFYVYELLGEQTRITDAIQIKIIKLLITPTKKYITNRTNYIKHRHSDNVVKPKEELTLKVPKTTKNRFIIKHVAIFRKQLQKRWDENNSKDAILSAKKQLLHNPGIEFTIPADNTMLEAARRVHNTR